jgi:hypothetical protein
MAQVLAWLTTLSPAHLIVMITLGVLLGLGIGPQETELVVLVGAAGLAIPTTTVTATQTATQTAAQTAAQATKAQAWPGAAPPPNA